jgi:hypothetical protein
MEADEIHHRSPQHPYSEEYSLKTIIKSCSLPIRQSLPLYSIQSLQCCLHNDTNGICPIKRAMDKVYTLKNIMSRCDLYVSFRLFIQSFFFFFFFLFLSPDLSAFKGMYRLCVSLCGMNQGFNRMFSAFTEGWRYQRRGRPSSGHHRHGQRRR